MRKLAMATLGFAVMQFAIGCSSEHAQQEMPDCSWSNKCTKRIAKTTHYYENTEIKDITYFDQHNRLIRNIRDFGEKYSPGETRYEYSTNGKVSKMTNYNYKGQKESVVKYKYDAKNRLIETFAVDYRYNESNSTVSYDYNDSNYTMTKITDHYSDGKTEELSYYIYDHNWTLREIRADHKADGKIDIITKYDEHGREIEFTSDCIEDLAKKCTVKIKYVCNSDNKITKILSDANNDGQFESITEFTYDSDGKIIKISQDGEITTYKYDAKDRLIETKDKERAVTATYNEQKNKLSLYDDLQDRTIWCQWEVTHYNQAKSKNRSYLDGKTWNSKKGCYIKPISRSLD